MPVAQTFQNGAGDVKADLVDEGLRNAARNRHRFPIDIGPADPRDGRRQRSSDPALRGGVILTLEPDGERLLLDEHPIGPEDLGVETLDERGRRLAEQRIDAPPVASVGRIRAADLARGDERQIDGLRRDAPVLLVPRHHDVAQRLGVRVEHRHQQKIVLDVEDRRDGRARRNGVPPSAEKWPS